MASFDLRGSLVFLRADEFEDAVTEFVAEGAGAGTTGNCRER